MQNKSRVLVAVSGGVDSSTALFLLKEQGYDVVAAHMKLWDYDAVGGDKFQDGRCCSIESINDLHQICNAQNIPFYVFNFTEYFKKIVIDNFVAEYKEGRTPNPCVLCNTHLKWSNLLKKAQELGCDYIATGHYAIIDVDKSISRHFLMRGVDETRDQSYFLWGLTQEALSKTLMPLGKYKKSEIREIARKMKLKTAEKPESRENCFIADDNYRRFLKEWEAKQGREFHSGDIVDSDGTIIGKHEGTPFYTIGQRKGLGISNPTPLYVNQIDPENNRIVVGDESRLYTNEMSVENINWLAFENPPAEIEAEIKIRYMHKPSKATIITTQGDSVTVKFKERQRAITPGQSAVFYDKNIVLGGGFISAKK